MWSREMSFKSIVRELRVMKDGIGNISRRGVEGRHWRNRTRSHIAPDVAPFDQIEQGQWANLPPELLLDIIRRVEESETTWPARTVVVFCASVCKSWREVTKEIVRTPEECGKLTFPISLKQVIYSYSVQLASCSYCQCQIKKVSLSFLFLLWTSLVPVNPQSIALSNGTEITQCIASTLAWLHVSRTPVLLFLLTLHNEIDILFNDCVPCCQLEDITCIFDR